MQNFMRTRVNPGIKVNEELIRNHCLEIPNYGEIEHSYDELNSLLSILKMI